MNAPDLLAIVLTLTPTHADSMPTYQGRAAHALFLRLVQAADAALAEELHETAQVKPFTCSDVWRSGPPRADPPLVTGDDGVRRYQVAPGETWHLRYTLLSAPLTALWLTRVLPALPDAVELSGVPFRVRGAALSPEAHPLAGRASYTDLAAPHLLRGGRPVTRWQFRFAAPTAFSSGGMTVPIPLPGLLFGSLLDRWNAWSPIALPAEVRRFAAERIAISRYRLRTRALLYEPGVVQRGAVGECEYVALGRDPYWCGAVSALAAYAFYSGAGYQTTRGMGVCRWASDE